MHHSVPLTPEIQKMSVQPRAPSIARQIAPEAGADLADREAPDSEHLPALLLRRAGCANLCL